VEPDMAVIFLIVVLASFSGIASANWGTHQSSSSQYIHSNDTFTLQLSTTQPNVLHGPPDSYIDLNFVLHNKAYMSYFMLSQSSEDGFTGRLSKRNTMLDANQQETIRVSGLKVPQRKNGEVVLFTLTARKQQARRKRSPEDAPGGSVISPGGGIGGSDTNNPGNYNPGGGSNYNPGGGGSNYNPGGGGGNYNPGGGGSNYNPGGGSNYNPGGGSNYNPGGGNNYKPNPGGSNYQPGYNPNDDNNNNPNWNPNDPANRAELQITVEYVVTTETVEDDSKPWADVEYRADSSDETCQSGPSDLENCKNEWWGAKFKVQDEGSGLHLITVTNTGKPNYMNDVYYRYENFKMGTKNMHEIFAYSVCCNEGMRLHITDVAGNTADEYAVWDGTGSGLSDTQIYIIIGSVGGVIVLIAIILIVVFVTKKYSRVPQEP